MRIHFTQTEHEPQVWGREDSDWAKRMEEAYSKNGGEHPLVDSGELADIIIFWEPHQDLQVTYAPRLRASPLIREFPNKAFIISIEDNPLGFLPGLYCSLAKRLFDQRRHRTCFYHRTPIPQLNSRSATERNHDPKWLASFVGARSHDLRNQFFNNGDPPIRNPFPNSSSISRCPAETCPTDHGPAVPGSGVGSVGISCPSTHPFVASLRGRTASAHLGLGSCLARGESRLAQAGCRTQKGRS